MNASVGGSVIANARRYMSTHARHLIAGLNTYRWGRGGTNAAPRQVTGWQVRAVNGIFNILHLLGLPIATWTG